MHLVMTKKPADKGPEMPYSCAVSILNDEWNCLFDEVEVEMDEEMVLLFSPHKIRYFRCGSRAEMDLEKTIRIQYDGKKKKATVNFHFHVYNQDNDLKWPLD